MADIKEIKGSAETRIRLRRCAMQLAMQLPEEPQEALAVIEYLNEIWEFVAGGLMPTISRLVGCGAQEELERLLRESFGQELETATDNRRDI